MELHYSLRVSFLLALVYSLFDKLVDCFVGLVLVVFVVENIGEGLLITYFPGRSWSLGSVEPSGLEGATFLI